MLKNDDTHPLSKKKKTMKNKNPNFVLPPMTEAPLRAARASGSQTKLLFLFSQHIWCAMLSGPSYLLPSRQVCQAQPLGGTFTWSNIHSNHGAAHSWTDLNMGLSALNSLNLFFTNDFIISINSSESAYWLVGMSICVLAMHIWFIL